MNTEIVKYETDKGEISLSFEEVKRYICPMATDSEVFMFLNLCKYQKLNPFLREVYLVKYSERDKAAIVVGKETFLKIAYKNPRFRGFKAGVIIESKTIIRNVEGSFLTKDDKLLGGWAEVYMEGYIVPIRNEVRWEDYVGRTKTGEMSFMWKTKGATMIRKVALCQSLREAMPEEFGGLYSPEEINTILTELPVEPITQPTITQPITQSVHTKTQPELPMEPITHPQRHIPSAEEGFQLVEVSLPEPSIEPINQDDEKKSLVKRAHIILQKILKEKLRITEKEQIVDYANRSRKYLFNIENFNNCSIPELQNIISYYIGVYKKTNPAEVMDAMKIIKIEDYIDIVDLDIEECDLIQE